MLPSVSGLTRRELTLPVLLMLPIAGGCGSPSDPPTLESFEIWDGAPGERWLLSNRRDAEDRDILGAALRDPSQLPNARLEGTQWRFKSPGQEHAHCDEATSLANLKACEEFSVNPHDISPGHSKDERRRMEQPPEARSQFFHLQRLVPLDRGVGRVQDR